MREVDTALARASTEVVGRLVPQDRTLNEAMGYPILWNNVRNGLIAYPPATQTEFMEGLVGSQGANFPNGEKIARTYVEVINSTWSPSETPDPNWVKQMIANHLRALGLEMPYISSRLKQADWNDATNSAGVAMRKAAQENGREEYLSVTRNIYRLGYGLDENLPNRGFRPIDRENFYSTLSDELQWVVVEDLMPQYGYSNGNPFEPLRRLYQAGLIIRGIQGGSFKVDRQQFKQAA